MFIGVSLNIQRVTPQPPRPPPNHHHCGINHSLGAKEKELKKVTLGGVIILMIFCKHHWGTHSSCVMLELACIPLLFLMKYFELLLNRALVLRFKYGVDIKHHFEPKNINYLYCCPISIFT